MPGGWAGPHGAGAQRPGTLFETLRALAAGISHNAMKIRWLCLLNVAFGVLAAVAVTRLHLSDAVADGSPISNAPPLNRLLEPIAAASIVVVVAGTLLATTHLALGLRRARRHASALLRSAKQPPSSSDWNQVLLSISTLSQYAMSPLKGSAHRGSGTFSPLAPKLTRARLLKLHWRHLALMQVWTSIAILILESVLIAWWWRPSLDLSTAIAVAPTALGMIALLLLVAWCRLLIGDRIDRFIAVMMSPIGVDAPGAGSISPGAAGPTKSERTVLGSSAEACSLTASIPAEMPMPSHSLENTTGNDEDSRSAGTEASDQQAVTSGHFAPLEQTPPSTESAAHLNPDLAEIGSAIDRLRAQQDAIKDTIQALAGALHGSAETHMEILQQIDAARTWAPRLQELVQTMIAHTGAIDKEYRQETTKLRDEMRERHEAQQRNIADVCASLNRLEARILPALRRMSSANRAMTIMVERFSQIQTHYAQPDSINPEHSEQIGSVPARLQHGNKEIEAEGGIVSELKQLMSDLEDATADPPSERP